MAINEIAEHSDNKSINAPMYLDKDASVKNKNKKYKSIFETLTEKTFLICSLISILSLIIITVFIFANGIPIFLK